MHPVIGAATDHGDAALLLLLLLLRLTVGAGRLGGHLRFDASRDMRAGVFSQVVFAVETCRVRNV